MTLSHDRPLRLAALAAIPLVIFGYAGAGSAEAQGTHAAQSEELIRWAEAQAAEVLRDLPPGTGLPPPSAAAIDDALRLFSTSPLSRVGAPQQAAMVGGSSQPSGGQTTQSLPPITIQLPPHPPESQAPPAQWRPPIQIPDPSAIPSPPLTQAPPQQQQPPIQLPNPSAGASGRPPIEPLTIPLPPHPPESQAPWNQRG